MIGSEVTAMDRKCVYFAYCGNQLGEGLLPTGLPCVVCYENPHTERNEKQVMCVYKMDGNILTTKN